jgi:hypothetical protein
VSLMRCELRRADWTPCTREGRYVVTVTTDAGTNTRHACTQHAAPFQRDAERGTTDRAVSVTLAAHAA